MPLYEYRCAACQRRRVVLVRSAAEAPAPGCESCGGRVMERILSRVSTPRSGERALDDLSGPAVLEGLSGGSDRVAEQWLRSASARLEDSGAGAGGEWVDGVLADARGAPMPE